MTTQDTYRAPLIVEFLGSEYFCRMDRPVRSPDLIRIEHAWNFLERAIATCKPPPRIIQCLKTELLWVSEMVFSNAESSDSSPTRQCIPSNVDFHKRILFSDEAHFWLNGYVNKQNCRNKTAAFGVKLIHKCHNVTVNGDQYRAMITNFFIPELNNHDVQELWFQQDGATCHTARARIDLLKDTFGDRLISRFGPVNCPP
ncbi:uncharacterized protein TNCV_3167781 [Trichonephila clavipes]|uniref:Transposase n=1 Tax=Trichonephila clavipes TaxID=2585209 RepID=A0A8X6V0P7_TRICX|nr:uncharacterized protein TNCV_3167781 [Trichonephila clavipes]